MRKAVYLDLDGAWGGSLLSLPTRDARQWGKRLRYIARDRDVDAFWHEIASTSSGQVSPVLGDFVLYGSGDFHHLAGVLIRRITATPFSLVSFDNHPDWDIRPPFWSCGGWAARTLRTGRVNHVSVWGCGNFELQWPSRLFADRKALRAGTLEIHAWAERQPPAVQKRFNCMTRENWRERFERFAAGLKGRPVYVTVDMDCLRAEEAVTNWENGLFTATDVAWAITILRANTNLIGGDVCGAYSPPEYERFGQRFAGKWDHPKLPEIDVAATRDTNMRSLIPIWDAMIK